MTGPPTSRSRALPVATRRNECSDSPAHCPRPTLGHPSQASRRRLPVSRLPPRSVTRPDRSSARFLRPVGPGLRHQPPVASAHLPTPAFDGGPIPRQRPGERSPRGTAYRRDRSRSRDHLARRGAIPGRLPGSRPRTSRHTVRATPPAGGDSRTARTRRPRMNTPPVRLARNPSIWHPPLPHAGTRAEPPSTDHPGARAHHGSKWGATFEACPASVRVPLRRIATGD